MSGIARPGSTGRFLSFNSSNYSIKIIDHIERRRCRIKTNNHTHPTTIPAKEFYFPVDRGVSIRIEKLEIPYAVAVPIRNRAGIMINHLTSGDSQYFPNGMYSIELSTPIKLYIAIKSSFKINVTSNSVNIKFEKPTKISIGARSHHEHPAGQITTSKNPEEMMKAVSYLSSALKTTTCERSYPSLRGHPPKIKLGDTLRIPQVIEKPNTGVTIKIPPDYRSIYITSPLAYYLGADLVPGATYAITTSQGYTHKLNTNSIKIEEKIKRTLKKCFFLDCLTRTEGYYQTSLHERKNLDDLLDLDFKKLYDSTLSKQIREYLDIDYKKIEKYVPKWKQTAHIEATPDKVEMLPFLIYDLSVIHSDKHSNITQSDSGDRSLTTHFTEDSFSQSDNRVDSRYNGETDTHSNPRGNIKEEEHIRISKDDSLEQIWVGDGIPMGASKSMLRAFKNRLERSPTNNDIDIIVIINDSGMTNEVEAVDDVYEKRKQLGFSAQIYNEVNTNELRELLQMDADFLHYIGHIDTDGFHCNDGHFDVTDVNSVNVDSFFLNACSSYQQAIELINAGAIAGIATTQPVLNSGAERIGESISRLLNRGFPLVAALEISKSKSIMGDNYVVIGDGSLDLTQPESGVPSLCELERKNGSFKLTYITYLTRKRGPGSITVPYINDNECFYLTSGFTGTFNIGMDELIRFLSEEPIPVKLDSKLYWSDEISIQDLVDH